jgi:hypothetical protein
VQYIGNLQLNYGFQPISSKDGVVLYDDKIKIKIPWSYLYYVAPDQMRVFHDDRDTPEKEDMISDGILASINYQNQWFTPSNRFRWEPWTYIHDTAVVEQFKKSYYVMKDNLHVFNNPALAVRDNYYFEGPNFPVNIEVKEGILSNDFDLDGDILISLILENPKNGKFVLNNDGSFSYLPKAGFVGYDSLVYTVYDGYTLSVPNTVVLYVAQNNLIVDVTMEDDKSIISLFPNPSTNIVNIASDSFLDSFEVFNMNGMLVKADTIQDFLYKLNVSEFKAGIYFVVVKSNNSFSSGKFVKH